MISHPTMPNFDTISSARDHECPICETINRMLKSVEEMQGRAYNVLQKDIERFWDNHLHDVKYHNDGSNDHNNGIRHHSP
jgi:hypothetical protein